jgi:2,4-dienoyl-CoA reductase-like NADH-dependent reductase (Old Yellow Enzyme family)
VACKVCATEGHARGATAVDAAAVAQVLEREGAHLLVLSGGMNIESPWQIFGNPLPREAVEDSIANPVLKMLTRLQRLSQPKPVFRELYQMEHSRQVRAAVRMPLAYLGGVKSLRAAEGALAEGFDCVALARVLIHDPELVNKFRTGAATESGCTSCNQCVVTMYTPGGTRCVLR